MSFTCTEQVVTWPSDAQFSDTINSTKEFSTKKNLHRIPILA
jgi:hypothetical protein